MSSTKIWTTQDIIDNAPNWNLAGDANLLRHLEHFSDDLLSKASETNNNLNKLICGLTNASLSLDLVKNEFSSLHNNQFIESRVYDDDETVPEDNRESDQIDDKSKENEKLESVKKAVLRGIEVVNKYFDKVELPASDSEDDTDFPSFVLKAKDPYADRPLPYVIGSDEWHRKWHVGLLDSSSESETEKMSEKFSDSDSDDDLPVKDRSQKNAFQAGMDADFSNRLSMNRPVANSTLFDESVDNPNKFDSSDSEDYNNSVPAKAPISNNTFAQELAAKLGDVIEQNSKVVEPPINTRPIQPRRIGDIIFDEPPPIDEEDGLFGNSDTSDGLFSGSGRLFDDVDNDRGLWTDKRKNEVSKSNLFEDEPDNIFSGSQRNIKSETSLKPKKISQDLFDDVEVVDDDLFTNKSSSGFSTKPLLQPYGGKTILPYFDDQPPELDPVPVKKDADRTKKPVGGVKLVEPDDLFGKSLRNVSNQTGSNLSKQEKEIEKSEIGTRTPDIKPRVEITTENPKQLSLFDDNDDLFQDDLFSNISTKKFSSSIFDDDLFLETPKPNLEVSKNNIDVKKDKLFDVDNNNLFENAKTDKSEPRNITQNPSSSLDINLFDDTPPPQDGDWDTKSDNAFDEREEILFDNVEENSNNRFDLFDNEPPSLFSESSGIIRDASTTRVETDDSFNPYASSSRRFSSDIYNEQQSSDSFFVTKNKSTLESQNVPTSIQEVSNESLNESYIDVTPSGNANDLYSESTVSVSELKRNVTHIMREESFKDEISGDSKSGLFRATNDLFGESRSEVIGEQNKFGNKPDVASKPTVAKKPSRPSNLFVEPDVLFERPKVVEEPTKINVIPDVSKKPSLSDKTEDLFGSPKVPDRSKISSKAEVSSNKPGIQEKPLLSIDKKTDNKVVNENLETLSNRKLDEKLFDSQNATLFGELDSNQSDDVFNALKRSDNSTKMSASPIVVSEKIGVVKKVLNFEKIEQKPAMDFEGKPKIGSPGKLKHNLNINVNALLPGSSLPKRKDTEDSSNIISSESRESNISRPVVSPTLDNQLDAKLTPQQLEKSTSFDSGLAEVLPSITKDRAKISVRRRPSTRKARQKSIRNSTSDFKLSLSLENSSEFEDQQTAEVKHSSTPEINVADHPKIETASDNKQNTSADLLGSSNESSLNETSKPTTTFQKLFGNIESENFSDFDRSVTKETEQKLDKSTSKLSKSTYEDFSGFDRSITKETEQKLDKSTSKLSKSTYEDLFGVESIDKNLIIQNKATNEKSVSSTFEDLFGTPPSDEFLDFSNTSEIEPKVQSTSSSSKFEHKNLFDSDRNDLFSSSPKKEISANISNTDVKEPPKSTSLFDDPLESDFSLFLDKETKKEQYKKITAQPPEPTNSKKADLFADSEEFDDIFSVTKLPSKTGVKKKSLFEDDDDDDIFGSSSTSRKPGSKMPLKTQSTDKKSNKGSQIKKLENSAVIDDPLSSFYEDI